MPIAVAISGAEGTLRVTGRFDFKMQREFRNAYDPLLQDNAIRTVKVNLSGTEYLDSSALGMLMLLHERCQGAGKAVILAGASETVLRVVKIANFDKLFRIE